MAFRERFKAVFPAVARDIFGLAGVGLVSYGAWLVYVPAGFISGGTLLIAGALLSGRSAA